MECTYADALRLTSTPEAWHALGTQQKVAALQAIEDHVADEQGRILCPISAEHLLDINGGVEMGHYEPSRMRIVINEAQLDANARYGQDPDALVETVLHEGRHAYQDQVVRGIVGCDEGTRNLWAQNMDAYVRFDENPRRYWQQPIEADARGFAQERLAGIEAERKAMTAARQEPDANSWQAARSQTQEAFRTQMGGGSQGSQVPRAADFLASSGQASRNAGVAAGEDAMHATQSVGLSSRR